MNHCLILDYYVQTLTMTGATYQILHYKYMRINITLFYIFIYIIYISIYTPILYIHLLYIVGYIYNIIYMVSCLSASHIKQSHGTISCASSAGRPKPQSLYP